MLNDAHKIYNNITKNNNVSFTLMKKKMDQLQNKN